MVPMSGNYLIIEGTYHIKLLATLNFLLLFKFNIYKKLDGMNITWDTINIMMVTTSHWYLKFFIII
jgi:multisubunit Na+/H+ antiporter MnhC subunit